MRYSFHVFVAAACINSIPLVSAAPVLSSNSGSAPHSTQHPRYPPRNRNPSQGPMGRPSQGPIRSPSQSPMNWGSNDLGSPPPPFYNHFQAEDSAYDPYNYQGPDSPHDFLLDGHRRMLESDTTLQQQADPAHRSFLDAQERILAGQRPYPAPRGGERAYSQREDDHHDRVRRRQKSTEERQRFSEQQQYQRQRELEAERPYRGHNMYPGSSYIPPPQASPYQQWPLPPSTRPTFDPYHARTDVGPRGGSTNRRSQTGGRTPLGQQSNIESRRSQLNYPLADPNHTRYDPGVGSSPTESGIERQRHRTPYPSVPPEHSHYDPNEGSSSTQIERPRHRTNYPSVPPEQIRYDPNEGSTTTQTGGGTRRGNEQQTSAAIQQHQNGGTDDERARLRGNTNDGRTSTGQKSTQDGKQSQPQGRTDFTYLSVPPNLTPKQEKFYRLIEEAIKKNADFVSAKDKEFLDGLGVPLLRVLRVDEENSSVLTQFYGRKE